jgi:hypothetical protein
MREGSRKYDVIVIGGGASGMLAAGRSAENGSSVLLLERNSRAGRKLGITGKGRCNLTNTCGIDDFIENYGRNGKFLYRALIEFPNSALVAFFNENGVATKEERGGRVFPASDDSADVVLALEGYMKRHGVDIMLNSRVRGILTDDRGGTVTGVELGKGGGRISAGKVILATGGLSYPATGSTGDGYAMAERLGHTIVPPKPALVPLETEEEFPKLLQGLSLENVEATVYCDGRRKESEFGDMLFTHFGVSGPIILKLSGSIVERLDKQEKVVISINLKPALDRTKLENRLLREFAAAGRKSLSTVMKNLLPKALVPIFLGLAGVQGEGKCGQVTSAERKKIAGLLADLRITVARPRAFNEAIITRGGVDLREVDPRTMESRKVRGLYFCGEVLDIDGTTGGFNLQAAFSTAFLAANS